MCGILGSVNISIGEDILDIIRHRGPDDHDLKQFASGGDRITLAHRRLSIVDLSPAGHQPMSSACGRYHIVFNGEIYNHAELRKNLNDTPFRGHSDTETIINYIARFGISSVSEFNGIFAFAVYDETRNSIYLARDRYGVKPLYYSHTGNRLAFCSEIKPLLRIVPADLDPSNLATLLRLRYSPSPATLFGNIHKLRPGHILELGIGKNEAEIRSFLKPVSINSSISYPDALNRYGELFEAAVKRQLMSDVDVGILLSGGIDSALVAYFARKYYHKQLKTFTVGFSEQDEANELKEAAETSVLLGTDHHEVTISSSQFDEVFRKIISVVEEPLGTTSVIPMYYLNQLVSRHVKVVLTGQGADEPLGGYARYQGELYRQYLPSFALNLLKQLPITYRDPRIGRAINSLGENNTVKRFDNIYALFSNEEIFRLTGTEQTQSVHLIEYFYQLLRGYTKTPVEAMMSNDLHMNLSDDLLLYTDKISMSFSIEARVPVLDNELIDFTESLPAKFRLRIGKTKIIHKDFASSSLPPQIVHRKKKGFQSPTEAWFKGEIGKKYYDLLTAGNSKFSTYFDPRATAEVMDAHIRKGINKEKQIFMLVSLYYWMEDFLS
jgi:asparagine synthase (glutamine-hydrolysing)